MENIKRSRIIWVDIAKGIGIISVIIGHYAIPDLLTRIIYSFHMPIFFIISGYFFRITSFTKLIVSRFRRLIIPYWITCLVMIILGIVKNKYYGESAMDALIYWGKATIYGSGIDHWLGLPHIGALWFLLAIFWGSIFLWVSLRTKFPIISILFLFCVGYFTSKWWLPTSIQAGMVATLYMYIGHLLNKYDLIDYLINPQVLICTLSLWCIGVLHGCGYLYLVNNHFGMGYFDFVNSIIATLAVINLSYYLSYSNRITQILSFAGKNSLEFLCFHILELNLLPWNSFITGKYAYWWIIGTKFSYVLVFTYILNQLKNCKLFIRI